MTQLPAPPSRSVRRRTLVVAALVLLGGAAVAAWGFFGRGVDGRAVAAGSALKLEDIPFNGAQAYEYLKQLCAIGPRPSGSPGMEIQQKLLAAHFQKLGGQVEFQRFRVPHPQTGVAVPMANIVVHWHPKSTSPHPVVRPLRHVAVSDAWTRRTRGARFVGANDNASGVAVLMELARDMPTLPTKYGIDFVLLDGEEFIFSEQDRFFLGSEYFAREYVKHKPRYHYRWGVLLDMVGDADLQLYEERNSVWWKDTRGLVADIMGHGGPARRAGVHRETEARGRRRPHRAARGGPYPLHRRDRFRLPALAYPRRHARQMLAAEPGQGGLGAAGMAEDSEVEGRRMKSGMTKRMTNRRNAYSIPNP